MRALGGLYGGSGDMEKADQLLAEQLVTAADIFKQDSAEVGLAEIAVGLHAQQAGDVEKSRVLLMSGVEKLRPHGTQYARKMISALLVSAEHYGMESQVEAMAAIRDAEEIANNAFGQSSVQATSVRIRLASTMTMYGDFEGSEKNFLAAIPVLERQLGPEHSSTLGALNNLGYLYSRSKAEAKAEKIHRELLQRRIAKNGPSHRSVGDSYQNLAGVITKQGRYDESVPLHRKAYDIYKSVLNDDNYMIAFPLLSISYAELQRARGAAAETAAREALSRFEASVPGTFLEGVARCLVGLSLEQQGSVEEGSALVDASHDLMKTGSIPDPYPALCRMPGS
jgi:tetratricopeptide (TPR) repeat protein